MKLYFKLVILTFALTGLVGFAIPTLISSGSDIGVFLGFVLLATLPAGLYYYFQDKKEVKE